MQSHIGLQGGQELPVILLLGAFGGTWGSAVMDLLSACSPNPNAASLLVLRAVVTPKARNPKGEGVHSAELPSGEIFLRFLLGGFSAHTLAREGVPPPTGIWTQGPHSPGEQPGVHPRHKETFSTSRAAPRERVELGLSGWLPTAVCGHILFLPHCLEREVGASVSPGTLKLPETQIGRPQVPSFSMELSYQGHQEEGESLNFFPCLVSHIL